MTPKTYNNSGLNPDYLTNANEPVSAIGGLEDKDADAERPNFPIDPAHTPVVAAYPPNRKLKCDPTRRNEVRFSICMDVLLLTSCGSLLESKRKD